MLNRLRMARVLFALALLSIVATAWATEPCIDAFDDPLALLESHRGDFGAALAGVGTGEGVKSFDIDVPGAPVAAYLYWSGEIRVDGTPDDCVTLSGGALAAPAQLCGIEVGRRHQVFADEASSGCNGNGGEVVLRTPVDPASFLSGANTFTVSDYNDIIPDGETCADGLSRHFRRNYGVAMVVVYEGGCASKSSGGTACDHEIIILDGADLASPLHRQGAGCEQKLDMTPGCFDFGALECDSDATLRFAMGGVGADAPVPSEQTWWDNGLAGTFVDPVTGIMGTGQVIEQDLLGIAPPAGFYVGTKQAIFDGVQPLGLGDTGACFQTEVIPDPAGHLYHNLLATVSVLDIDRSCGTTPGSDECFCGVEQLDVVYTGNSCDVMSNPQNGKASCSGNALGAQPVVIEVSGKHIAPPTRFENVYIGQVLTINADKDKLGSQTVFRVIDSVTGDLLAESSIHTSCSKPLAAGDDFGPIRIDSIGSLGTSADDCRDDDHDDCDRDDDDHGDHHGECDRDDDDHGDHHGDCDRDDDEDSDHHGECDRDDDDHGDHHGDRDDSCDRDDDDHGDHHGDRDDSCDRDDDDHGDHHGDRDDDRDGKKDKKNKKDKKDKKDKKRDHDDD